LEREEDEESISEYVHAPYYPKVIFFFELLNLIFFGFFLVKGRVVVGFDWR
jgi:hypothetical protein